MLVQDIMQTKVFTVTPDTTLREAIQLTGQRGIRHLPVVDGERLVGIVSDRDLKRAVASPATSLEVHELLYLLSRVRVRDFMTATVITIGPMSPVEDAARLMVLERIGALVVTDGERLVGIVTETDVLRLFVRAMGAGEPSTRLDVILGNRPHALAEAVHAVDMAGGDISSIVTLTSGSGLKEAVIRVRTIHPAPVVWALETKGFAARGSWRA
jgi:acetoin utilization protein AcuB